MELRSYVCDARCTLAAPGNNAYHWPVRTHSYTESVTRTFLLRRLSCSCYLACWVVGRANCRHVQRSREYTVHMKSTRCVLQRRTFLSLAQRTSAWLGGAVRDFVSSKLVANRCVTVTQGDASISANQRHKGQSPHQKVSYLKYEHIECTHCCSLL